MERNKVWFITGCSTGFGRELSKLVLELGYKAIVTARNPKDIQDITENYPDTSIPIQLDVTNKLEIENSILKAKARFGRIDILVNNAGIGYFGAIEESEEEEVRRMFEINFFGLANVTNPVLPIMRAQRNGMIINIASIGGLVSFPAVGFYNATKFAVDGYSEVLAKETSHLGIKVMIVAPSGFRTDWAGRSANNTKKKILDYEESAGANMQNIRASSGNQAGDPVRAVKAIVKAVESENPPMRLLLGKAALRNARNKLDSLKKEFDEWEETTVSADYPQ